jgi:hypothetical protein
MASLLTFKRYGSLDVVSLVLKALPICLRFVSIVILHRGTPVDIDTTPQVAMSRIVPVYAALKPSS